MHCASEAPALTSAGVDSSSRSSKSSFVVVKILRRFLGQRLSCVGVQQLDVGLRAKLLQTEPFLAGPAKHVHSL